jgi:hypothetical protein
MGVHSVTCLGCVKMSLVLKAVLEHQWRSVLKRKGRRYHLSVCMETWQLSIITIQRNLIMFPLPQSLLFTYSLLSMLQVMEYASQLLTCVLPSFLCKNACDTILISKHGKHIFWSCDCCFEPNVMWYERILEVWRGLQTPSFDCNI